MPRSLKTHSAAQLSNIYYIQLYYYSWVSLEPFSVILSGGQPKCIDDCTALEQAHLAKLHAFVAKHKVNTYSENFFQSDESVSIWS